MNTSTTLAIDPGPGDDAQLSTLDAGVDLMDVNETDVSDDDDEDVQNVVESDDEPVSAKCPSNKAHMQLGG